MQTANFKMNEMTA